MPPAGPVDAQVLSRLAEGVGGDTSFVSELIEQLVADTPALPAAWRDLSATAQT